MKQYNNTNYYKQKEEKMKIPFAKILPQATTDYVSMVQSNIPELKVNRQPTQEEKTDLLKFLKKEFKSSLFDSGNVLANGLGLEIFYKEGTNSRVIADTIIGFLSTRTTFEKIVTKKEILTKEYGEKFIEQIESRLVSRYSQNDDDYSVEVILKSAEEKISSIDSDIAKYEKRADDADDVKDVLIKEVEVIKQKIAGRQITDLNLKQINRYFKQIESIKHKINNVDKEVKNFRDNANLYHKSKKPIEAIIKVIADKRLDHYESLLPVKDEKVATKKVKI